MINTKTRSATTAHRGREKRGPEATRQALLQAGAELFAERGFDGVFVAADGGDCALVPDCTARTAWAVERAQQMLTARGQDPRRLKMGAICSVCAEPFVNHMKQFGDSLSKL